MKKIITLSGHKYCGKVSVAIELAKNSDMEFIHPVTDKPSQQTDYYGDEYTHISKERMNELVNSGKLLSMTVVDKYRYCFFDFQLKSEYTLMIVDDDALSQIIENFDGKVFAIRVYSDNEVKTDRVGSNDDIYDELFHFKVDDLSELEWRIGYEFD